MKVKLLNRVLSGLFFVVAFVLVSSATAEEWKKTVDGQWEWVRDDASDKRAKLPSAVEDAAVARTRQQVSMLDDLYKTVVVLVTEHYVTDPSILSAASAAKALFAAMKEKGWHDVRLVGFTNVLFKPDENSPRDEFERNAKKKLLEGSPTYEEVITQEGKRYLRIATQVPVVMEKCIMCHANFEGNKGAIGALSYTVPLVY